LEPLIQNSIDHSSTEKVIITIQTIYRTESKKTYVLIKDNGKGVKEELLEENENGVKRIFAESESTKIQEKGNNGYGCYIAYQMATIRCGWKLDVNNLEIGGCQFSIEI